MPDWFKKILFINGLPGVGKTQKLYHIIRHDRGADLVLNLRHHKDIDGIRYSVNYIKARNHKRLPAYRIPKYSSYARFYFIKLFYLTHPRIKHVLIDEVERYRLGRLIHLCRQIHYFYPHVPIIMVGVIKNDVNQMLSTSQYLLYHCRIRNLNPRCKYCANRASFILNVYHGHKITHPEINRITDQAKRKQIKDHMARYHVCFHHYVHPPSGL